MENSRNILPMARHIPAILALEACFAAFVTASCTNHLTSRIGSFQTPNFPSNYPPSIRCNWIVSINSARSIIKIELTFSSFDLEEPSAVSGHCIDYVLVYKGLSATTRPKTDKLCGSSRPSTITIHGSSFLVEFVSVGNNTGKGFNARYSAYEKQSGMFTSSQATAGIVAAIFCGLVFVGIAVLRCAIVYRCCREAPHSREVVGTHETFDPDNSNLDCPPSYRTVMEHPERFPTPTASMSSTPHSTPLPSRMVIHPSEARPRASTLERIDSVDDDSLPPYPGIINGDLLSGCLPNVSTVDEEEEDRDGPILTTASIEPLPRLHTNQRTPVNELMGEPPHADERNSSECDNTTIETEDGTNQTETLESSSVGLEEPFGSNQEDIRGPLVISDRASQERAQDGMPDNPTTLESLQPDELSEETSGLPQHSGRSTDRRASSSRWNDKNSDVDNETDIRERCIPQNEIPANLLSVSSDVVGV